MCCFLPSSGDTAECNQYTRNLWNCDTHCSIQDLSPFRLLLPDSGEGPLWRLVVLFVAGLTLQTQNTLMLLRNVKDGRP